MSKDISRFRQCGKTRSVFMSALYELREEYPEMSEVIDEMAKSFDESIGFNQTEVAEDERKETRET